ncbi:Pyrroline-5-carboxylate reductase 3-like [Oopsacas minuta]|uniref:Pyrroline-5-carboxylate reductase 3 n=1 Tax=Oopsacas minuta TaxID=111878 RepID=A0AAV7K8T4_9METZ|nr:Pyrroline-5-carboxylate reductase 3-like [Oopsacas minuta]
MAEQVSLLPKHTRIGFIGYGNIVVPLVSGWLRTKSVRPDQIMGSCLTESTAARIRDKHGIEMTLKTNDLVEACNIVFVAVKPHLVQSVVESIPNWNASRHLVVSLAACVTLSSYSYILPEGTRVIRLALNTGSGVLACASAMAVGVNVLPIESSLIQGLMNSVGTCLPVEEKHIDTVSSVCGCGIAYMFLVAEALADGGLEAGLKKDVVIKLAAQTLIAAGKNILEYQDTHVSKLKDNVCSPGGITIKGLHSLERNGVRNAFLDAVEIGVKTHAEYAHKFEVKK